MLRWANFLHIYQPPTQKPYWIHKITAESYRKIFDGLHRNPSAKMTLNINAVLLEHFEALGETDVIDSIRTLLANGQLELTGSAKFHTLLPFLPDNEIRRQIRLNEETHRKYFGNLYRPRGFFPPEMGFDIRVAKIAKELGYAWIIADELSFPRDTAIDYSKTYTIDGLDDFKIYFRERKMSWVILSGQVGTGPLMIQSLGDRLHRDEYLLTAMDGETFGHHRPGLEELLFEIYRQPELETIFISDIPAYYPATESIMPIPSTWALMERDLEQKKPFSRWHDEDNEIHRYQWDLTHLALDVVHQAAEREATHKTMSAEYQAARTLLDRALHSDQYWWASARPWWSIEMIERGAKELLDTVLTTPGVSIAHAEKAKALYQRIVYTAFDWQRSGKVDELAKSEDEEIRQQTDAGMPKLPKKEIDRMIANLQGEIALLVKKEEYERAAQLRDRIAELRRYASESDTPTFSAEGDREWTSE